MSARRPALIAMSQEKARRGRMNRLGAAGGRVRDLAWVVLLREELHIAAYCLNDVPCGTTAFSCGPTPGLRLTYRQQRKPRIDQCRRLLPAVSCPNIWDAHACNQAF